MDILDRETAQPEYRKLEYQGRVILLDEDGYLVNGEDWSEGLADHFASLDGLALGADHREVIRFIREYYVQFQGAPMAKIIIKRLNKQLGTERFTIKSLFSLFPESPLRRACRYAGVPQPAECT
jgi:TusE/DsrC/DsvC family sulfur relay protein